MQQQRQYIVYLRGVIAALWLALVPAALAYAQGAPSSAAQFRGGAVDPSISSSATSGVSSSSSPSVGKIFTVSLEDAERALGEAIARQLSLPHAKATLLGQRTEVLYEASEPVTLEIKTLRAEKSSGRFSGNILVHGQNKVLTAFPASGRFEEMVEVPVLSSRVLPSQAIGAEQISTQFIPKSKWREAMISSAQELIGRTAKRGISPGRPIRKDELNSGSTVQRGDSVTMRFDADALSITSLGEALDDGEQGQTIRVRNIDSKKIVHAMVESAKIVRVMSGEQRMQASDPGQLNAQPPAATKGESHDPFEP